MCPEVEGNQKWEFASSRQEEEENKKDPSSIAVKMDANVDEREDVQRVKKEWTRRSQSQRLSTLSIYINYSERRDRLLQFRWRRQEQEKQRNNYYWLNNYLFLMSGNYWTRTLNTRFSYYWENRAALQFDGFCKWKRGSSGSWKSNSNMSSSWVNIWTMGLVASRCFLYQKVLRTTTFLIT